MKVFKEKFESIEFSLVNSEGEEFVLSTRFVTANDLSKIQEQSQKVVNNPNDANMDHIYNALIILIGKDEKFWSMFSVGLLIEVMKFASENLVKKKTKN